MSATQPVGGVTTRHEFVVNGWTKALVSADPFCRLQTRTANRQLNGHDHGNVPAPTARAEVWSELILPASLTPPAEEECTGAFRSFDPNRCLVRFVGQDLAAATQGSWRSKGWPQDRLSLKREAGLERQLSVLYDGLLGSTVPFWEKDTDVRHPDSASPQTQHTHATTGTHSSCHHLRAWRLACTCVPSVIGACVAASKAVAAASVLQEDFSPCVPVWMPWSVLFCEQKAFPPVLSSAQLLPSPLPSPSVLPSSPSRTASPSVFFSFSWPSGSEPGFFSEAGALRRA